jgi:uncharacterized protein (DUF1330 family)
MSGPSRTPVKTWLVIGVVVAVASLGYYALGKWQQGGPVDNDAERMIEQAKAQMEANRRARIVVISADQLLNEYQNDPKAASKKYKGKYLEISGVVERVNKDSEETPFVILHGGNDNSPVKIECFFDLNYEMNEPQDQIKFLGKGQRITLRGEFGGQISHLQVRFCTLVK